MRAFVAGATGYTGKAVVRELRERGITTFAHLRPGSPTGEAAVAEFRALGAEPRVVAWRPSDIEATVAEAAPELVFALLGTTRKRARREGISGNIYQEVEGNLTTLLLEACGRVAPRARFVFLSALGTKPRSKSPYLEVRATVEGALAASGIPYTIARPGLISGDDREESRPTERVAAAVVGALLAMAGLVGASRLRTRFAPMTAAELARALVDAALDPAAENRVLELPELLARGRQA